MVSEVVSPNRAVGVGLVQRYAAGHSLQWLERHGVRQWRVTFPGRPPVPFDTEADARDYAEGVQAEADRRQRQRAGASRHS